jgi:hypothetical protein
VEDEDEPTPDSCAYSVPIDNAAIRVAIIAELMLFNKVGFEKSADKLVPEDRALLLIRLFGNAFYCFHKVVHPGI